MRIKHHKIQQGWTLWELMSALGVLAVAAAIAMPVYQQRQACAASGQVAKVLQRWAWRLQRSGVRNLQIKAQPKASLKRYYTFSLLTALGSVQVQAKPTSLCQASCCKLYKQRV